MGAHVINNKYSFHNLKQNDNNFSVFSCIGLHQFCKSLPLFISWKSGCYSGVTGWKPKSRTLYLLEVRLLEWSRQFEIMDSVAWNAFFNWVILYVFCLSMIFSHCHLQALVWHVLLNCNFVLNLGEYVRPNMADTIKTSRLIKLAA
jgi:hypothetical protein